MDGQLKQRLMGAAVLVALGVIFIPVLLDSFERSHDPSGLPEMPPLPAPPEAPPLNRASITLQGRQQLSIEINPVPDRPLERRIDTGDGTAITTGTATVAGGEGIGGEN